MMLRKTTTASMSLSTERSLAITFAGVSPSRLWRSTCNVLVLTEALTPYVSVGLQAAGRTYLGVQSSWQP